MRFFLMIPRPPRSTLFPYTDALPISDRALPGVLDAVEAAEMLHLRVLEYLAGGEHGGVGHVLGDRESTRLNSSHANISYADFCLKKKPCWVGEVATASQPVYILRYTR